VENVANEDYSIDILNSLPGSILDFGIPQKQMILSDSVKTLNKKVLLDKILFIFTTVSPCVLPGHIFVGGQGSLIFTSTKIKSNGFVIGREKDSGKCIGSFTNNNSGAIVVCQCNLKIDSAGQDKVKGG